MRLRKTCLAACLLVIALSVTSCARSNPEVHVSDPLIASRVPWAYLDRPDLTTFRDTEAFGPDTAFGAPDEIEADLTEKYPIVTDPDLQRRTALKLKRQYESASLDVYTRSGHRDPAWDEPAIAAIQQQVLASVGQDGQRADHYYNSYIQAKKAHSLGCRDGLILYILSVLPIYAGEYDPEKAAPLALEAARAMEKSGYPLQQIFRARSRYIFTTMDIDGYKPGFVHDLAPIDLQRDCLARLWKQPDRITDECITAILDVVQQYTDSGMSTVKAMDEVEAVLKDVPEARAGMLYVRGDRGIALAWAERGSALASKTTGLQFERFRLHLTAAEGYLREAWEADPSFTTTAERMITACMGMGHPREEMETWYKRAMLGSQYGLLHACLAKAEYLMPQWNGSEEEVRAFARQCARTWDDANGLPRTLILVHKDLARWKRLPRGRADLYVGFPEYWEELKPLYAHYAKLRPGYRSIRTELAIIAFSADQYHACARELHFLRDDYDRRFVDAYFKDSRPKWRGRSATETHVSQADSELRNVLSRMAIMSGSPPTK